MCQPGFLLLPLRPNDQQQRHARFTRNLVFRTSRGIDRIGVGDTGDPMLPTLGRDVDIRTDVPRYRVFRDGAFVEELTEISSLWSDDLVTVALGCSFTFENALMRAGIPVRHIELGRNVPMFRTNIELTPAGPVGGQMVVTMRPLRQEQVDEARAISAKFPQAHGAPIAVGDPSTIGITDLSQPDYGDPVEVKPSEVPVYWACGLPHKMFFGPQGDGLKFTLQIRFL